VGERVVWEYAIMRGDFEPRIAQLNEMGAIGWELTTYVVTAAHLGATSKHILTFKRQKGADHD